MLRSVAILIICFAFFSCHKYVRTERICDKKLYLEVYERLQLGVSYLTDSANFKIYVGQLNFGVEYYRYECKGDSLFVFKYSKRMGNSNDLIETKSYSLKQLKEEKKFEK